LFLFIVSDGSSEIRHPKVRYLNAMMCGHEKIRRFDIAVNDALIMKIFQPQHRVPKGVACLHDSQTRDIGHIVVIREPFRFGRCIAKIARCNAESPIKGIIAHVRAIHAALHGG